MVDDMQVVEVYLKFVTRDVGKRPDFNKDTLGGFWVLL